MLQSAQYTCKVLIHFKILFKTNNISGMLFKHWFMVFAENSDLEYTGKHDNHPLPIWFAWHLKKMYIIFCAFKQIKISTNIFLDWFRDAWADYCNSDVNCCLIIKKLNISETMHFRTFGKIHFFLIFRFIVEG